MRNSNTFRALRITAGVMVLMMLVAVLFAAFCIAIEADHECSGDDCPICSFIHQCVSTFHSIGNGPAVRRAAAATIILISLVMAFAITALYQNTLISRKVRLNN